MSILKRAADRLPVLGRALRDYRDQRATAAMRLQPVEPYGFAVWGGNYLAAGNHEAAELAIVAGVLRDRDLLVDVGANSGLFACLAASMGVPSVALEPMPGNLDILRRNIAHNGFTDLIEIMPVAASDSIGTVPFYGREQGASLIRGWGGQAAFDKIDVPTDTLDNLVDLRDRAAFVKIDVEGAELSVLRGATRLLASRPPMLIEISLTRNHPDGINPDFATIFEMLWGLGYVSAVADEAQTPVDRERVGKWISDRASDAGTENFIFR